ncbi:MAG: DUF4350 domain-containing protein [Microthrixaceae bacterium]
MSTAPAPSTSGSRTGLWIGIGVLLLAVVLLAVLSGRTPSGEPFDVRSSAPDGYRAVATLLRERGATVRDASLGDLVGPGATPSSPGEVVVVPLAAELDAEELRGLRERTGHGATLVLGEPPADDDSALLDDPGDRFFRNWLDPRALAEVPAQIREPGECDIAALTDLGPIDDAFAGVIPVAPGARSCYGDGTSAVIQQRANGRGTEIVLSSPYLWVNARLQPTKESGGEPLDNAVTALRLLGAAPDGAGAGTAVVVARVEGAEGLATGSEDPISLLPVPVQLALLQLLAAFVIYIWWRSRRLGRAVVEQLPVEIEGSELVAAVGDLLRRKGNATRAAATLRHDTRRELGMRLGVPPTASLAALVEIVAARSGQDPAGVHAALADTPVPDATQLVRLARTLHALRQEVLDVSSPS